MIRWDPSAPMSYQHFHSGRKSSLMAPPKKRKRVKPTPKEESESSEEEKLQERPKKRRKRGPVSFMEKSKLPRYAGIKTQIQAKRE